MMLAASFTITAIAIGVAVWLRRENRRLYGRNVALGLDKNELEIRVKALRAIAGYLSQANQALELALDVTENGWELPGPEGKQ
jgi:hypothetical protein